MLHAGYAMLFSQANFHKVIGTVHVCVAHFICEITLLVCKNLFNYMTCADSNVGILMSFTSKLTCCNVHL
jgi:hypothetical protein